MALTKATLIDLNSNELILDLDADTSITADTDDTIHFKIAGADELVMTGTALTPAVADGSALGSTSLEWSDIFLADGAVINFGADQDINITHVADTGLTTNADFTVGDDLFVSGGLIDLKNTGTVSTIKFYCESSNAHAQSLVSAPHSEAASNTLTLPGTGGDARLVSTSSTATLTNKTLTTPVIAEIDSGSTITLDATTDIVLDADGGDIFFKDAGTTFGSATNTSGNLIIKSGTTTAATFSGANVTLAGTVGSGAITSTGIVTGTGFTAGSAVLAEAELELLDGLTAGTAIASKVVTTDASIDTSGQRNLTISGELDAATGDFSGAVDVAGAFTTGSTIVSTGKITADAGIDIDNFNIDGTTIALSSGDLTIDVAGRITLSADDNGEVKLADGSSVYGQFKDDDDRLRIEALLQDKDIMFVGNDGGSEVTAASFDISDAGKMTVNNGINVSNGDISFADGHGIDFSATADSGATGATDSSEILKDYEEGDWTPASNNLGFATIHAAKYIKIGEFVSVYCDITRNSSPSDTSQGSSFSGMPFNAGDDYPNGFSTCGNVTEAVRTSASGGSMSLTGLDGVPLTRSQLAGNRCQHYVTFNTL